MLAESSYRAHRAVSASDVRTMAIDYEAWSFERRLKLEGRLPPWMRKEPTDAMLFGTAVHLALLEPDQYVKKAVIMPYVESFALKAGKDIKKEAEAVADSIEGGFVLRAEHAWAIEQIQNNFEPHRAVLGIDENAIVETPVFGIWEGHTIKGCPDALTIESDVDLKTTRDIANVRQTMADARYPIQLAHYNFLAPRERQIFAFIENQAPFRVEIVELDREQIELAAIAWRFWLRQAASDNLL